MVNAQEWLNEKYPVSEEKSQLKEIIIGGYNEFKSNLPLTQGQAKELVGGNLNLSEYPNLEKVWILGNHLKTPLTKLELGEKLKLTQLVCVRNQLTALDLVGCPNLEEVRCWKNDLVELELSKQKKLTELSCSNNKFEKLNLINCPQLKKINCSNNQLTSLDLSGCPQLTEMWCSNNKLIKLRLGNLRKLTKLDCNNNQLNALDLSKCPQLGEIECTSNKITKLNIKGCLKLRELDYQNNPVSDSPEARQDFVSSLDFDNRPFLNNWVWKVIHPDFAKETYKGSGKTNQQIWEEKGFTYQEAQAWIPTGFKPVEYDKVKQWKDHNFTPQQFQAWKKNNLSIEFVVYLRQKGYRPDDPNIKEIITRESWRDIHPDFNYQLRKGWEQGGFDAEQTKEWINAGAETDDYGFVGCLRDVKNYGSEWVSIYKEDYQILNKRFKNYGLCRECKQPRTGDWWCQPCNVPRLEKDFDKWTSHNTQIDKFIQEHQLAATDADKFIEWIPYEQFADIEYLAKGGFGKVYKAKWIVGSASHWDTENKQWYREKDDRKSYKMIVLKSLNDSQETTSFLEEIKKHKIIDDWFNNIVPCYGISQDPQTKEYLMIMQYMPEGNLRKYLSNKKQELSLKEKISQLFHLSQGLKDIHQKNLVHRDFHSGNILKGIEKTTCLIADLGLCKPANELDKEEKIYGVMPYVAPEVLQEKPYTQASDIYSFGIIAYEILSGLSPYYDRAHDVHLALEICQGLRPQFQIKIPQLLEDLIKKCWDADPAKRPTASELEKILRDWVKEINGHEYTKFKGQFWKAEKYNQSLPDEVKFPKYRIHRGAIYTSRLLPTKEVTKLLKKLEIDLTLDEELKELAREFVRTNKKMLKGDKEAKNKIQELEKKLEAKGLSEEKIEAIIRESEADLDRQEKELQAKIIEVLPKK
jgi:serine/threonine protein kinase/Leucine-rich repeat (LRR) protein